MAQLEVDIVDAEGTVWSGTAALVAAPAADGEIGVLAGHTPVLSVLRAGELRVTTQRGAAPLRWRVSGGFLSVDEDRLTAVVDDATPVTGTH